MSMSVLTNINSLTAQNNLSITQSKLSTAIQRLSSGLRINSAKDDAAGMAIATRFTTQINGLNQAVRNANDGISLAQTTESALNEVTNNLQRIRELSVQSANATNSSSDRAAINQEVQQRIAEISRIASQTSFNGLKVLDGSFGQANFQVGADVGNTIGVNLSTGVGANQIGQIATGTGGAVTATALTSGGLTIAVGSGQAVSVGASVAGTGAGQYAYSAYAKAAAINSSGVAGVTATATNAVTAAFSNTGGGIGNTYSLSINGVQIYNAADTSAAALTSTQVVAQVNLYASQTGVTASISGGYVVFNAADGRDINLAQTLGGGATGGVAAGALVDNKGTVTLTASNNITMTGQYADLGFASGVITKDVKTLANVDVTTVANSNDAISRMDSALATVSDLRSQLGAIQNRFQSTIANLQSISQNLDASRSSIQDANFAQETANMSSANIMQQAGVSVLAQANSSTQSVLKLLQ